MLQHFPFVFPQHAGPKLQGGGYGGGGDTPLQSEESWSGRANYMNSSGEFLEILEKYNLMYGLRDKKHKVIEETIHSLTKIRENESEIARLKLAFNFPTAMEQNQKNNLIATTGRGRCHKDLKKFSRVNFLPHILLQGSYRFSYF